MRLTEVGSLNEVRVTEVEVKGFQDVFLVLYSSSE